MIHKPQTLIERRKSGAEPKMHELIYFVFVPESKSIGLTHEKNNGTQYLPRFWAISDIFSHNNWRFVFIFYFFYDYMMHDIIKQK